jgi:hypothetical protein
MQTPLNNKSNYKVLFTDLEVVRKKSFQCFEKTEKWPVKEKEFHEFSDFTRSLYNRIISTSSGDMAISDISLVETIFVNQIIDTCHYNFVNKYCEKNNIELISGDDSTHYFDPSWDVIGNYYLKLNNSYNKLSGFFRNKIKNIIFNKHLSIGDIFFRFFANSEVVGIGSNDRIKQDYLVNNKLFCDNRNWKEFINNALYSYSKSKDIDLIDQFSQSISEKIIKPFLYEMRHTDSMFVEGVDFNLIEKSWLQRFLDAYKIYKGLFLIDAPKMLLVTEVGKPYSKLITLAFQRRGCKVFNFHHGNDSVLIDQHWVYQLLFSHCDNYVLDTKVMRDRFKSLNSSIGIRKEVTNFISIDSNYYAELRNLTHNTKNKKVMLMGYPMNLDRYLDDSYLFFHYKITLEYMLADMMHSSGYHVSYKAHPDRLKEIQSIMSCVSDKVVELPFEDVWREAGVLIFTYLPTTTFCYALNLPMPIVFIEMPDTPWYKNMRNIVEKRVSILTVKVIDEKFIIDKRELFGAIDEAYNKVRQDVSTEITG